MMTGGGSFGKKAALTIIRPFISLWVVIWFWPSRWVMHNRFLFRLKNPRLKPALLSLPFVYASLAYLLVINEFRRHFTQYALQRYVVFIRKHYSIGGLGYLHTENMNEAQRVALFSREVGRIRYFLDHNKSLIPYQNGDTFLDAGCGKGQNIRVISERYPDSKIRGFDFSQEAVEIVKSGTRNNPLITVETGDICDPDYLSSLPDASFDHIIVSHVIGFLCGPGTDETRELRQQIIDQMIRISSTSVMILDTIENLPDMSVEVEQNTRCIVHDRLMNYFEKYTTAGSGEVYGMFSDESSGLLYLKSSESRV